MAKKKKRTDGTVEIVVVDESLKECKWEQAVPVEEPEPMVEPLEEIVWEQAVRDVEPEAIVEPPQREVTEAMPAPLLPGQRPKVSPYRSQLVTLRIGPNRSEYRVPQDLLQNGLWEAYLKRIDQKCLEFPSMAENTGHVLVHYLHTGTYQTLDDSNTGSCSFDAAFEFERAVLVYFAALEYELRGLEKLAKDEIQEFGLCLNIFEALSVIDTSFVDFPDKADWLNDYLCMKAKGTFERNYAMFSDDALLNRVTNINLNRILIKAVVGVHATVASKLHDVQRNVNEITPQDVIDGSEIVVSIESVVEVSLEEPEILSSNESAVEEVSSGEPEDVSSNESTMEKASFEEPVDICIPEVATSETVSEIADYAEPGVEFDYPASDTPYSTLDVECMPCDEVVSFSDSEPTVDIETTVCPNRCEHLSYGSNWKTCKECRAGLRDIFLECARKNRIDEKEYEHIIRTLSD